VQKDREKEGDYGKKKTVKVTLARSILGEEEFREEKKRPTGGRNPQEKLPW